MERFNIRVYALIINDDNQVLLSHENRFNRSFKKFPGGGLEWGEGTKDTLRRELLEETSLHFEVEELFYVNDFFQQSAFKKTDQLFSFYYRATREEYPLKIASVEGENSDGEVFHWHNIADLKQSDLTFPIDKIVAGKLKEIS